MADYHPIDVRYKGPSTAWRGKTRWQPETPEADTVPMAPKPRPAVEGSPASPWQTKAAAPSAESIVQSAMRDQPRKEMTRVGPIRRQGILTYSAFAVLVLLYLTGAFGVVVGSLFEATQINAMP